MSLQSRPLRRLYLCRKGKKKPQMEVHTGVLRTALKAGTPIGARLKNIAASGNYNVTACHILALRRF